MKPVNFRCSLLSAVSGVSPIVRPAERSSSISERLDPRCIGPRRDYVLPSLTHLFTPKKAASVSCQELGLGDIPPSQPRYSLSLVGDGHRTYWSPWSLNSIINRWALAESYGAIASLIDKQLEGCDEEEILDAVGHLGPRMLFLSYEKFIEPLPALSIAHKLMERADLIADRLPEGTCMENFGNPLKMLANITEDIEGVLLKDGRMDDESAERVADIYLAFARWGQYYYGTEGRSRKGQKVNDISCFSTILKIDEVAMRYDALFLHDKARHARGIISEIASISGINGEIVSSAIEEELRFAVRAIEAQRFFSSDSSLVISDMLTCLTVHSSRILDFAIARCIEDNDLRHIDKYRELREEREFRARKLQLI